jgi:hypothetical protein
MRKGVKKHLKKTLITLLKYDNKNNSSYLYVNCAANNNLFYLHSHQIQVLGFAASFSFLRSILLDY